MCIMGRPKQPAALQNHPALAPPEFQPRPTSPVVAEARGKTRRQAAAALGNEGNVQNEGGARGLLDSGDTEFGRATLLGRTRRRVA